MRRLSRKFGMAAAVLLPLVLLLVIAVVASGQGDGPALSENTASALAPAAEFVDDGFIANAYHFDESGGFAFPVTQTATCMQAPIYLPDGATVSKFGGYVYDNDTDGSIAQIELRRVAYQPGPEALSQLMARASTTKAGASDAVVFAFDDQVDFAVVDNPNYLYYAVVCMSGGAAGDGSLRLYAVEAFYSQ